MPGDQSQLVTPAVEQMRAAAAEASAMLGVLANASRLLLLCEIGQGEKCVSELEAALDLHQPSLSQQLGVLRAQGLVNTRRDGKRVYYSIADARLVTLLCVLHGLYCPRPEGTA